MIWIVLFMGSVLVHKLKDNLSEVADSVFVAARNVCTVSTVHDLTLNFGKIVFKMFKRFEHHHSLLISVYHIVVGDDKKHRS